MHLRQHSRKLPIIRVIAANAASPFRTSWERSFYGHGIPLKLPKTSRIVDLGLKTKTWHGHIIYIIMVIQFDAQHAKECEDER